MPQEPQEQYEKAISMTTEDESPRSEVSSMLLRKIGGQLLIAPERMKRLGQSGNDAQLWICLVVKV